MAIIITDECINCGACEPECPNTAIYEGADDWRWKDGTKLSGKIVLPDGTEIDSDAAQTPVSDDLYYIVPGKCTECKGFHEEPQCAAVCPVDCCVPDDNHVESEETLLNRQAFLHNVFGDKWHEQFGFNTYKQKRNSKCACLSGKKYKKCCGVAN